MALDRPLIDVVPTVTAEALTLRILGDIDPETGPAVQAEFQAAAAILPPPPLVIVDLLSVGILSAAGLRLLLQFATACNARGIRVCLVAAPGSTTLRVIEIVGMDESVPTFPTVVDALRAGRR